MNSITVLLRSWAAYIASIILSSGISLAAASIITIFFSVEATVRAISDFSLCSELGLNTNSPFTKPTTVEAIGPSKGISEIAVEIDEPSIAVISGGQS